MLPHTSRRSVAVLSSGIAAALALAGCGAGGSASAGAGGAALSETQRAAVKAAEAEFAAYIKPRAADPVPALPAAPPTGKTLTIIGCPIPVCAKVTGGATRAARKLGWKVTSLQNDNTPQSFLTLLNQVVQNPPDMLAYIGLVRNSSVTAQLSKLHSDGTKIVEIAPIGDKPAPAGPVDATVIAELHKRQSGRLMGDAVVADAKGPADTVFVWDPSFAVGWGPIKDGYSKIVKAAGGSVGILEVSNHNIGKTIPSQIVSYLQAHPSVKYVALAVGDYAAGLAAAKQAAGLQQKVRITSRAANATNLQDIKDGTEWTSIGEENAASGYRAVDQLVRLEMGIPLGSRIEAVGWHQIFTQGNVTQTATAPEPPDYAAVYEHAWHVG
ncbi:substrate-binding domain-containing protein [Streptomyces sp. PRh5]|uniref:sugar ABC transporter substrate-binding protein n=1 Tax=Streptomyces sp. PRh5 TaxID=1158056 RepID=UPI0004ACCF2D|nr:substrate-binding domain-containing protein [Streptomyces sp. PRh5]